MTLDAKLVPLLEGFGQILNKRLASIPEGETLAFGRQREVELLSRHLDHSHQNSFLLVGPSGCGKTAVLQELVRRVGLRKRKPWIVLETSTSQLLAGTRYLGEWQTRLHDLLNLAQRTRQVALYCTDIAHMTGAGKSTGSEENMAAVVTPHVERGDLVLIGECTGDIYRQSFEAAPWFKKIFTVFRIEPQPAETIQELLQHASAKSSRRLEQDLNVTLEWPESTVTTVRQFGQLYFPGAAPPSGAVQLLDHLINHKRESLEQLRRRPEKVVTTYEDVVQALESFTGLPSLLLDDSRALDLKKTREFFEARVIGQKEAVDAVVDLITLVKAGLNDPLKPLGVLFFVGPTGVGKTELAKALAEFIFGSADRMIRYDMSEFKDYHSFEKLIGRPNPEDSAAQSGSLLSRVRQQPFAVILLDEIEKAHDNLFDLLLQLFDAGRLSDPRGETVDFTQTIVIMTSNLGSQVSEGMPFGFGTDAPMEDAVAEAMKGMFRPELINRIDRIVRFRQLERGHIRLLARRELGHVLLRNGLTRRQLRVDVEPGVIEILAAAGFHPAYGARPLKRAVQRLALLPIARQLAQTTGENRPALLRLLPAGDKISLALVHDRQTRKSESIARGVKLVDPVDGARTTLKPAQIGRQIEELAERVVALEQQCEQRGLAELKTELVRRTTAPDFWDEPVAAREALSDLYRVERLLEAISGVRRRVDELTQRFGRAEAAPATRDSRRALTAIAEKTLATRRHAELIRFSLHCRDRRDRCDAFLVVTAVDAASFSDDHVGQLADMYCGWARSKGFAARIVHEVMERPKVTQDLVVLIEGVAVYGMLQDEDGIHEFVYARSAESPRVSHFVKVRALPIEDDPARPIAELEVQRRKAKGAGRRVERFKIEVQARDRSSGCSVTVCNDLPGEQAAAVAVDLLLAETQRLQAHGAAPHGGESNVAAGAEEPVRRYTLKPRQSAKDRRTGVTKHNLRELWRGDMDEFLTAAVERRNDN